MISLIRLTENLNIYVQQTDETKTKNIKYSDEIVIDETLDPGMTRITCFNRKRQIQQSVYKQNGVNKIGKCKEQSNGKRENKYKGLTEPRVCWFKESKRSKPIHCIKKMTKTTPNINQIRIKQSEIMFKRVM